MGKNKSGGSTGGFLSFVNSIITDKVKLKSGEVPTQGPKISEHHNEETGGDLALMQLLSGEGKPKGHGKEESKNAVVLNRGVLGLGYEKQATVSELAATTQIQRLKNQIRKDQEVAATEAAKESLLGKSFADGGKHDQVGKKQVKESGSESILKEKREKKRLKKQRQKERQAKKKAKSETDSKPSSSLKHAGEIKHEHVTVNESKDQIKEHFKERRIREGGEGNQNQRTRIRTKTRSKQKNKKRDNRPIEVKRAKLAEKGIII